MNVNTKKAKVDFFNNKAKTYDKTVCKSRGLMFLHNKELDIILKETSNKKFSNFLDVGIGTGRFATVLNKKFFITGIDISKGMLKEAKRKLIPDKHKLIKADGENLPFKDNIFDGLLCIRVFGNFGNVQKALKGFSRVMKNQAIGIVMFSNLYSLKSLECLIDRIIFDRRVPSFRGYISLKKLKKLSNLFNLQIIKIYDYGRLPKTLYILANTDFLLRKLLFIESFLDFVLPKHFLSTQFIMVFKKI